MTNLRELYRCDICSNLVEVVYEGASSLVCCNQPMVKLEAKTLETEGKEKHVPVLQDIVGGVKIMVGSIPHPMEEKHYIKFIEVLTQDEIFRAELKPGQRPEAEFCILRQSIIGVREFCNIHMLWRN